jgi:hypothetical protein
MYKIHAQSLSKSSVIKLKEVNKMRLKLIITVIITLLVVILLSAGNVFADPPSSAPEPDWPVHYTPADDPEGWRDTGEVFVGLSIPDIVELVIIDAEEVITPGPEDYARDLEANRVVNYDGPTTETSSPANNTGNEAAVTNVMYNLNEDIGKGFAERAAAFELTIFTNSQDGAALYVYGRTDVPELGLGGSRDVLKLEDTYLSVNTEKTYILQNDLEGAFASACTLAISQDGTLQTPPGTTPNETTRVEDNPRNAMGLDHFPGSIISNTGSSAPTNAAYSTWLRMHSNAQQLFEVKMATAAPRLISIDLGIANLAEYTRGEYANVLTFTLMPVVG